MKASYNTPNEIAQFYIESGLRDKTDVISLINESGKKLMQKIGKEEMGKILTPFMQNRESLFTVEGLALYLETIGVESVSFLDPMTGKIEHSAYINLK